MILKKASNFIDTINSVKKYINRGMFLPDHQQANSMDAIQKRIKNAIIKIEQLLDKACDRSSISTQDFVNIFGYGRIDDDGRNVAENAAKFLKDDRTSDVDFYEFILDFIPAISAKSESAFKSNNGYSLVSKIEALLRIAEFNRKQNKLKAQTPAFESTTIEETSPEPTTSEVITSEEPGPEMVTFEEPTNNKKWYVSSSDRFSSTTPFYGPFESGIKAVIFSILIHRDGFSDEASVVPYENLVQIFKNIRLKESEINKAKDIHSASIVNESLLGRIKTESLKITKGNHEVVLSTSGQVFDAFVDFIVEKRKIQKDEVVSLSELSKWMEGTSILSFAKHYLELYGPKDAMPSSVKEVSQIDAVLPNQKKEQQVDKQQKQEQSKVNIKEKTNNEIEWRTKSVKQVSELVSAIEGSSISIISKEDTSLLSEQSILEFINSIKAQVKSFGVLSKDNYKESLIGLELFFEKILDKDFDIKKTLQEFRAENPLQISTDMNFEWEFRERFSILKRISTDNEIRQPLVSFLSQFAIQKFFAKENIRDSIQSKIKSYINRKAITYSEKASDIDTAITVIEELSMIEVSRVLDLEFTKSCKKILYTPGIAKWNSKNFIEGLIDEIVVNKIFYKRIENYFDGEQEVLDSQKFCLVKCGVCSQMTQIPEKYKNLIESFTEELDQYSFFRKDGTVITEEQLIGGDIQYDISPDASGLIAKHVERSKKLFPKQNFENFLRKQFSWKEVNLMISSSEELNPGAIDGIEGNIIGLIIRNDILKNKFDAMSSGKKGIFSNRSLCAASLIGLSPNIKASETTKKFLEQKNDFKCKATILSDYSPSDIPKYFSSAYIQPGGNILAKQDVSPYFSSGFRFSKNEVRCPCHISADSNLLEVANKNKSYSDIFGLVAIPTIPQDLAEGLANKFERETQSFYSAPTTPNGDFATNIPQAGYVVCGKKVSLSLIDKDPSSINNIRNVFWKIYKEKGKDELISVINLLINYGVEMNDIRPHVEDVLSLDVPTKVAKKNIKDLFRQIKISLAQELASESILKLRDVGLVCENGHKFTIGQSWDFAKTHFAIVPKGRVFTSNYKGMIKDKLRLKDMIDLIKSDSKNSAKMMFTSPGENVSGFGVFSTKIDKEYLEKGGYKQPTEVSSYEELRELISKNLLYYQSDDGSAYIISENLERGALVRAPWQADTIKLIPQSTVNINLYANGMESLTQQSEGGGNIEKDLQSESTDVDYDDDDDDDSSTSNATQYDDSYLKIMFPDQNSSENSIERLGKLSANGLKDLGVETQTKFKVSAKDFIEKFITTIKLARIWGLSAVDANIDFLKRPSSTPDADPNIEDIIKAELSSLLDMFSKDRADFDSIFQKFFSKYDILGLISRSVSQDKFLSLAGINAYYAGFKTPSIINKKDPEAKEIIKNEIKKALVVNLPEIIGVDIANPGAKQTIEESADRLAQHLFSPYQNYDFKRIFETAIVDYSGRAMVFSLSIDIVERMKNFYSIFFSNKDSSVFVGTHTPNEAFAYIEEFLSIDVAEGNSFYKIFLMEEEEFNVKISKIKEVLEAKYSPSALIKDYLNGRGVNQKPVPEFFKQIIIILSRYAKSMDIASNYLQSICGNLGGKPMGSPSIKKAAKILDVIIEPLLKRRYPSTFEEMKERVFKSRNILGGSENLFSTNAVGTARINLSKSNESLEPIVSSPFSIYSFTLSRGALIGLDQSVKIDPELAVLTSIMINDDITKRQKEYYLSLVPMKTSFVDQNMLRKEIDLMDYFSNKIIKLNSKQGHEFASRYISSLKGVDYSRLVLVDSELKDGRLGKVRNQYFSDVQSQNSRFDIKISKIKDEIKIWPPKNNLFFDKMIRKMHDEGEDPEKINSYIKTIIGKDHKEFMTNLENFPNSLDSMSPEVSSDLGVIIPLKGEALTRMITNTSGVSESRKILDLITISKSQIFITLASGEKLDISWAFKNLDPQFLEEGVLRHKLVQSGVVQKLDFISRQIDSIYRGLQRKSYGVFDISYPGCVNIKMNTKDDFLESFFSVASPCITLSEDIRLGIKKASLNGNHIVDIESVFKGNYRASSFRNSEEEMYKNLSDFKSDLSKLADYYNAAQILNSIYLQQQPSIIDANSENIRTKKKGTSLAIHLLDPYSLWMIVSNPFMGQNFGGPIDPRHVDDYKNFIIETFGINDIVKGIVDSTGIRASAFQAKDLFDLSGFYNRYYQEENNSESDALKRFAKLFHLNIEKDNEYATALSYSNGYPIRTSFNASKPSEQIVSIMSSAYSKEFCLNDDSFIEHPYRFEYILENMSESKIKDIKDSLAKSIDKDKIKEKAWVEEPPEGQGSIRSRMRSEIANLKASGATAKKISTLEKKYIDEVDNLTKKRFEEALNAAFLEQEEVLSELSRNKKLESGEDTLSLNELHKLADSFGITRNNRPNRALITDYRALTMEINSNLRRILANIYNPITKESKNYISWRKIAQFATDNESTIIASQYHKWWDAYLAVMEKLSR